MNDYRWEDLRVGLGHSFEATITADAVKRFSELSGDVSPLHVEASYARSRGYPDVVVHGFLTSSLYSTLVGVHLPGKRCLLQGVRVDFMKPVFPGERLIVQGEITHMNDAYKQLEIRATIRKAEDESVISKAKLQAGVHDGADGKP
jgi:3-hydroxybutyryl-CoA dehydratase